LTLACGEFDYKFAFGGLELHFFDAQIYVIKMLAFAVKFNSGLTQNKLNAADCR
jgi:hypothetical protein